MSKSTQENLNMINTGEQLVYTHSYLLLAKQCLAVVLSEGDEPGVGRDMKRGNGLDVKCRSAARHFGHRRAADRRLAKLFSERSMGDLHS